MLQWSRWASEAVFCPAGFDPCGKFLATHIKALVETENRGLKTCMVFECILPSALVKLYSAGLDDSGNLRRAIPKKGNMLLVSLRFSS